ncbi:MAG TPA: methylmalonyl Co-A mutase-associated GTPase MeaB [Thermoanaerobaculia bacterium]|nr:methylmalonyl Co-A mutase-associated GTPase MeaB [Thermoanaerobaculia bacterium]
MAANHDPDPPDRGAEPAGTVVDALAAGIESGDRAAIGQAITLVESRRREDEPVAHDLLQRLLPLTGTAHRVGLSGVPGVGKSTFIEALGAHLTAAGHRVAVLAVDPSSPKSGGSILGDKTRMPRLAADPQAFIRPSPSGGALGGVARRTRESMLVCEAAGFDVILVETVGTGQSEVAVAGMVDTFVLLLLAGAGDELQGIKKGVLELADVFVVTKADGDNRERAARAAADLTGALRILRGTGATWQPPVLTVSARDGTGVAEVWQSLADHRHTITASGELTKKRRDQQLATLWGLVEERAIERLRADPRLQRLRANLELEVERGNLSPGAAAERLLEAATPLGPD